LRAIVPRILAILMKLIRLLLMRLIMHKRTLKRSCSRKEARFIMNLTKESINSKSRFRLIKKRKRIVSMTTSRRRKSSKTILRL
jgi:hypothetical protein